MSTSAHQTPQQQQKQQQQQQQQQHQHQYGSASEGFTPEMRDRQARGKDPYVKSDGSDEDDEDDDGSERGMRPGHGPRTEPFEEREKRGFALSVLDSPEHLMMYAQSTGDSIPGQRQRFTAMLCGFDQPPPSGSILPRRHHLGVTIKAVGLVKDPADEMRESE